MQLNNLLKSNLYLLSAFGLLISLSSCGSFEYVGQDSDGIYNDTDENVEYVETSTEEVYDENNSSVYYQNYFKDKSTFYEEERKTRRIELTVRNNIHFSCYLFSSGA